MSKFPSINEQMDVIRRGISEVISEEELVKKLENAEKTGKPLNVKLGCDPSRPDLHLGHSVVLRKLAQFQELGHQAILIIGDFTGMIGDPSGKSSTRPALTLEETRLNGQSYFEQASKILHPEKTNIKYNSEWLGKMTFTDVIKLASKYTVARMLERDDFTKRYKANEPISIHEFLYPLAQAMDSVAINSDVELGGTDQKFNLLVGRDLQREYGQEPQCIITMPILVGLFGKEKMSKSLGNYIGISEEPQQIFGKTLSISDDLIYEYFNLVTDLPKDELLTIKSDLENGTGNPRDIKRRLARTFVRMYHSEEAAVSAQEEFDKIYIKKEIPDNIAEMVWDLTDNSIGLVDLIMKANFASSRREAKGFVTQGGVKIDSKKITDLNLNVEIEDGMVLQVGSRKFVRIKK